MTEPAYVVMPVRAGGSSSPENDKHMVSAIEESLHERLHPTAHGATQGPLKRAFADQDSLYKYISWEDPVRTIGSYLGMVALMYGVHYLHWGQWLLKMGATGLGVMSLLSFVSRSTKSDLVERMRPEYKTVPEPTLNATLKDIHDFVQYLTIQVQRVLYGEDLRKTFGGFVGLTSLFWLVKILTPFDLEVLGLSSVYLAPLILSPRGRETAQAAEVHAEELANTASHSAKGAFNDTKAKTADVSAKSQQAMGNWASGAQQGAKDMASGTQQTVGNMTAGAQQGAKDLTSGTQRTMGNWASGAQQSAKDVASGTQQTMGNLASGTQQGAKNIASSTRQTVSGASPGMQDTVGDIACKLRETTDDQLPEKSTARTQPDNHQQASVDIATRPLKVTSDGRTTVADRFNFQRHVLDK